MGDLQSGWGGGRVVTVCYVLLLEFWSWLHSGRLSPWRQRDHNIQMQKHSRHFARFNGPVLTSE